MCISFYKIFGVLDRILKRDFWCWLEVKGHLLFHGAFGHEVKSFILKSRQHWSIDVLRYWNHQTFFGDFTCRGQGKK